MDSLLQLSYSEIYELSDLKERRLYLNAEVDEAVFDTLVYNIMRYNAQDKGIPVEDRKPIFLFINSPGGSVSDGYGLIDAIVQSKTPVYTVNQAMCASMAFLIFIAGDKRYTMPHSEFLMHDGSGFCMDSTAKLKDRLEFETNQLERMTKNYILERTNISEELYNKRYRMEWYFLPEEAKDLGVATHIIGVDCDIDEIV